MGTHRVLVIGKYKQGRETRLLGEKLMWDFIGRNEKGELVFHTQKYEPYTDGKLMETAISPVSFWAPITHEPYCRADPDRDPYVGCECGATLRIKK